MVMRLWTWMHWYLLLWQSATSSVLPMCHVRVLIFVLGCEATYNIQLHLPGKSSSANFQSFCSPLTVVKEVLTRHILMSWIFATSSVCPNNHPPPNASSIHSLFWAQLQHSYLCPVWYFAKQVPPRLLLLSWKFVKTVFLVTDHPQPKLTPIRHVHFPYRKSNTWLLIHVWASIGLLMRILYCDFLPSTYLGSAQPARHA